MIRKFNPASRKSLPELCHLSADQVILIEEALHAVGDFGEVRLVINRGRLHYLITQKSFNLRNCTPGEIIKSSIPSH